MAHFNHLNELSTNVVKDAIKKLEIQEHKLEHNLLF